MMKRWIVAAAMALVSMQAFADMEKEIAACAAFEGGLERLECYDELAAAKGLDGPQTEAVDAKKGGKWDVSIDTNPIDDSKTVFMILIADSGSSRFGGRIGMAVRCKSNKTEFYINWSDYLGSKADVLTRIGKEEAVTKRWSMSSDKKATFYPSGTINFLKAMMEADEFVAQVTPFNENPITAVFDTTGMQEAIKPVREACNW